MTTATLTDLKKLPGPRLLELYNRLSGENVKRFASKEAGLKRLLKLLTDPAKIAQLEAIIAAESAQAVVVEQPFDDGTPIASLQETFEGIAEKEIAEMAKTGKLRPKEKKRATKAKKVEPKAKKVEPKVKPARTAGAKLLVGPADRRRIKVPDDKLEVKPIEDSSLVSLGGRVIRRENIERVKRGELLWGKVLEAPKDADRLSGSHARSNLNYPTKAEVREPREGTKRARLLAMLREKNGTTVELISREFKLTEAQAIYMLRDLHYTSGYGLEVRKGRIHLR